MQDTTKSFIGTSVAHFVNDGSLYVFIILYPKILPSQVLFAGILGGLQNILSVAVSPAIGRTADSKKNYGFLMALGLVMFGIGIVGYSIFGALFTGFDLFLFLVPFAITAGVGSAFYHPLGASALREKWGVQRAGRITGINGALGSVGRALYPLFVVTLVVYFTVPSVILLAGVAFVCAAVVSSLFHGMQFQSLRSKTDEKGISKSRVPMGVLLPGILALTIFSFIRGVFALGIIQFIPYYLKQVNGFQYGFQLGLAFSLMLGMGVIGQPVFGYIADKFGRRLALGIASMGSSISMLLFLYAPNPLYAVIYLSGFGFFIFTGFPLLLPLAASIAQEGASTMSGSIVWGMGNVGGGAVGPVLAGILAEPSVLGSLHTTFLILTIFGVVGVLLLPFVPKPRPR